MSKFKRQLKNQGEDLMGNRVVCEPRPLKRPDTTEHAHSKRIKLILDISQDKTPLSHLP